MRANNRWWRDSNYAHYSVTLFTHFLEPLYARSGHDSRNWVQAIPAGIRPWSSPPMYRFRRYRMDGVRISLKAFRAAATGCWFQLDVAYLLPPAPSTCSNIPLYRLFLRLPPIP